MSLASKIRKAAQHEAMRARNLKKGVVIDADPLKVDLFHEDRVLEVDDDFDLSWTMTKYEEEVGFDKGDVLVLMRENGEWTAMDVIPD